MLLKTIKHVIMFTLIIGFTPNSFAYWSEHKGSTTCVGDTCHHTTVNKGCVNGHCGVEKTSTTWHR